MRAPVLPPTFVALALVGCNEFRLDPVDDDPEPLRVVLEDSFVQEALPKIDLLFVVDDTASMAQEQAALADASTAFVGALDDAGLAWHTGVVRTDMTRADAGWLRGDPWVLTSGVADAEARFADAVQVGVDGGGPEAGLAVALQALDLARPDGPNAGFRRDDAALHVVFVSDGDDESDGWLGEHPVAAFLEAMEAEAANGLPARASAIVGDLPSGCASDRGTARPAARYHQVAEATGGVTASICAVDFAALLPSLSDVSVAYQTRFPLSESPDPASVRVSVDGVRAEAGWVLDLPEEGGAAVVFADAPAPGAVIVASYVVEVPG